MVEPEPEIWDPAPPEVCGESEFYQYFNGFWFSMDRTVLELEPKTSRCWSWKFEFRLYSPGYK